MQKLKDILRDILVAVAIGLGIGIVLITVFAVIGGIVDGLEGALEASRGVVLIVGGLLMLFSAILMLKGGNLPPDAFRLQFWKTPPSEEVDLPELPKLFTLLPRKYAILFIAIGILTTTLIPESFVLYYLQR